MDLIIGIGLGVKKRLIAVLGALLNEQAQNYTKAGQNAPNWVVFLAEYCQNG